MKDFYAILGLDIDASPETIKITYRRLAREAHPDRVRAQGSTAQAEASTRMAELNEAYSTLSNPARRKEYDIELRAEQLATEAKEAVPAPTIPTPEEPATPTPSRARSRADAGVGSSVVQHYSEDMFQGLLSKKGDFAWQRIKLEGFDWALESSFWMTHYLVAFRGFGAADREAARKVTNYAQYAMEKSRSVLKQNFYLFVMAFQRINNFEQTLAELRRFAGSPGQKAIVMLVDVNHQRVVPCGPRISDARFEKLMGKLASAR